MDPVAICDEDGEVVQRFEYSPFGRTTFLDPNFAPGAPGDWTFLFHGEFRDVATGYYNYGFRFYNDTTGRWPSRDPIGERDGINLYGYVGNNGINLADRLGLISCLTQCGGSLNGEFSLVRNNDEDGIDWQAEATEANGISAAIDYDGSEAAAKKPCCCDSVHIIQFIKTNWANQASTADGYSLDGNFRRNPFYPYPPGGVFPEGHPQAGDKFGGILDAPNRSDTYLKGFEGNDVEWKGWTFAVCIKNGTVQSGATGTIMLQGIEWGFSRSWNKDQKTWNPAKMSEPKCVKKFGEDGVPTQEQIKAAIDLDGNVPGGRGGRYYKGNIGNNPWIKLPPF
jgi:RHS repeat-associated protein